MTFGYDSEVTKFFGGAANQNTFYQHAEDLLGALARWRQDTVCKMSPRLVNVAYCGGVESSGT